MAENRAEPAGVTENTPRPAPIPQIEARVHELVRHGLKVHDIAGLLGVHPRVVTRAQHER